MPNIVRDITMVGIKCLKPYKNNARINDHVVPELMNSIRRFGFLVPCVITRDMVVVCGHTRLKAAKALGMLEVPCVFADGLTEDEINAYRLADNKLSERSMWDFGKLDEEMKMLSQSIDMTDFGFTEDEISGIHEECGNEEKGMNENQENEEGEKAFLHKCPSCGFVFEE